MPSVNRGLVHWLCRGGAILENTADRLNHVWTVGILLLLAAVISLKQATSRTIVCNTPAMFTSKMAEFVEDACWNSHFIQYSDDRGHDNKGANVVSISSIGDLSPTPIVSAGFTDYSGEKYAENASLTLYQWLPTILCFQALLFKLPNIMLHILHGYFGLNFIQDEGLTFGITGQHSPDDKKLIKFIAKYVYNWCRCSRNSLPWRWWTLTLFFVKCLYCSNAIAQLVIIDRFIRMDSPLTNYTTYAEMVFRNMFSNNVTTFRLADSFPRRVFCKVVLQISPSVTTANQQCLLPVNDFNETLFMLVWVWLAFVAITTVVSMVIWTIRTLLPFVRTRYIRDMLFLTDALDVCRLQNDHVTELISTLGEDGVMALKLIGANTSDHVVRDVVWELWILKQTDIQSQDDREAAEQQHSGSSNTGPRSNIFSGGGPSSNSGPRLNFSPGRLPMFGNRT